MRQKRTKGSRKVMQLYQSAFGFREPYQLLMDAAFVQSSVKQKFELMSRLHDVLQGAVKPMITQCCMQALYDLGEEAQDVVDVAKGFERRKCNHLKARPEDECLTTMAGADNRNRYVFATQSLALRQALRKVPGSPIIYIARSVLLLEAPSDQTLAKKRQPLPSAEPEASTSAAAAASDAPDAAAPKKPRKPKGPKGPNPLSVRKKKAAPGAEQGGRPPKKRGREEGGDEVREGGDREAEREGKRKREEESRVASMPTRGDGEARKKRKRRRKGDKAGGGEGGGQGAGEAGEAGGGDGGGSGAE
ncbi:PIN domain-like protein [Rhodotorula diobovata]|uniref:U three protein 23 n=1 Tax=Rhodotorula diobovata TaxID=5288 RepID=A0A5C5G0D2_9BASI|nr:PIN domain-like protein [Rhodotorula diobovata]